jgi:hypothetical protein
MNRYENSKTYRLVGDDGSFYIGSTCMPLCKRFWHHKIRAKKNPERKVYQHFNSIGWENVKIILIEQFICFSKEELLRKEQIEIDKYKNNEKCLNNNNAIGFDKKEYQRIYYQIHKEYMDEKHKQKNICEICGGKYTHANKSIHLKTLKHLSKISNE